MTSKPLNLRFIVTATLLGNTLEWYDAAIFGFLAPILIKIFFPITDIWSFPLLAIVAFVSGHVLRPVGGLFLGYISDRYGRRMALLISIMCISFPTLILGILPSYWDIGVTASILFIFMRLLQGLSAGGEFPAVITFLVESSPKNKQGFIGSFAYFGVALGICLGGLDFYLLHSHLAEDSFSMWGWRSMYVLGGLLGIVAFWLRFKLHETPIYEGLKESHEIIQHPISMLFHKHKVAMLKLIGIETLETLGFNLTISFFVIYLTEVLKLPIGKAIHLNLIFLMVLVVTIPVAGFFASKIGAKKLATYAGLAYVFLSLPIYWFIQIDDFRILSTIVLGAMVAFYMAPMATIYCLLFPTRVRTSGIGFALNLAIGLIGGFAPVLALGLIRFTGVRMIPGIILVIGALISLATLRSISHHHPEKSSI